LCFGLGLSSGTGELRGVPTAPGVFRGRHGKKLVGSWSGLFPEKEKPDKGNGNGYD
jgi:hypothetical protein